MTITAPKTGSPSLSATGDCQTTGDAVVEQNRAAALLPANLLQGGEIIILLIKPSPWYILLAPLGSLAAITIVILLAIIVNDRLNLGGTQRDLILLGVAVGGLRLFWQFFEWLSRIYVLTDRRLIRIKGVLRVQVFEAPLKQIQHTTVFFSLRERFFRLGTIAFATAGTAIMEASWEMVARPLQIQRKIIETIHRYR